MFSSAASRWRSPSAAHSSSAATVSSSARVAFARLAGDEREVVQGGDPAGDVVELLGDREPARELGLRGVEPAAVAGEHPEHVVGLGERAPVDRGLGQRARLVGEQRRALGAAALVQDEAHVGEDAGARARRQ